MSRFARSAHPRIAPCRSRIERLEPRRVLSFAAVAVDPAPGAHLTTAPAVLTVTLITRSTPSRFGPSDIQLDRVDGSGVLTSIDGATEAVGRRDDQLILTPGEPLSPGHNSRRLDRCGLGPGASTSYRVALNFPSIYTFQGQYSGERSRSRASVLRGHSRSTPARRMPSAARASPKTRGFLVRRPCLPRPPRRHPRRRPYPYRCHSCRRSRSGRWQP